MTGTVNTSICNGYMFEKPKTNWTSTVQVKQNLRHVDLTGSESIPASGLPIISDGKRAYIDDSDNHCAIFGASGFKKSTCCFLPLIGVIANANENMFVLDPKGELYSRTGEFLKAHGYRIIVLNFRDFNADGYNPLHMPARLWREFGETDKAAACVNEFASALAQRQENSQKADPFWPDTAKAFIGGVVPMMFDTYNFIDDINIMSLANYFTDESAELLKSYISGYHIHNAATINMNTVLSEPDRTRMSTLSTCSSFIQPFLQNDKLCRMLSHSTFELDEMTKEKTALFVITDDTTTTCNSIIATLISQLQTVLVDKAFHSEGGKLKTRVNFILEEMCSLPIDLTNALATQRSRGIRYYLCIQSIDALHSRYPHYEGMLANCATTLFLGSTEIDLLKRISERCGTTSRTRTGESRPLISVPELMTLKKSWNEKEAIYLNLSDSVRYCTTLPAIEQYESFCRYGKSEFPNVVHPPVKVYTFKDLMRDIRAGKAHEPFTAPRRTIKKRGSSDESGMSQLQEILEAKFDELFGTSEED